ncbi:putative transferase CAF17 homolog, mitochondrial [Toxorhynchites rutilus septentrionalis]|uniref:putative transferase CAF17 homolog, mitochondrial n=1 Tax=Toxorhynchites rutilus septentrionalis TaxID=329112 RepID=UPI0024783302|nr:putative transferase CAF17 homolog, mitochondrial [Toxorhynchites rutilus septentrionalis]
MFSYGRRIGLGFLIRPRYPNGSSSIHVRLLSSVVLQKLQARSILCVQGSDASSFLQGLITNDMNHLKHDANSIYAMFLNSTGRILYDTIIHRTKNEHDFLVECESQTAENFQKHLNLFRIRKKVKIIRTNLDLWVTFVKNGKSNLSNIFNQKHNEIMVHRDPRLKELGYRIITESMSDENLQKALYNDVKIDGKISYDEHRYSLGIGEGLDNIPQNKCFPLEYNCDYMHGVSFHKGCYIGQELTARTYHTGVVRKRIMPLFFNEPIDEHSIAKDTEIKNQQGQIVGKLRGVKNSVGLALLRIEKIGKNDNLLVAEKYHCTTHTPFWWPKKQQ